MNDSTASSTTSTKKILLATLVALVIATILLVTTVLPAEFNIDPLGTGKLLGIAGMSEEQSVGVLSQQPIKYSKDTFKIVLAPYESIEYKYYLAEGAALIFDWQATGTVLFDLHAEKDGVDPQEYSPSFDQRQSLSERGSYTAPFSGLHGWYWENRTLNEVSIELNSVGFFSKAIEFGRSSEKEKLFD